MKKILLSCLLSCLLYADEAVFTIDPTTPGLEYYVKSNGSMVFRQCGAKVPEKREQEEPQVLNPEFISGDCIITIEVDEAKVEEIAKKAEEAKRINDELKKRVAELKELEFSKREKRIYDGSPNLKF